jgi:hypothetical protein
VVLLSRLFPDPVRLAKAAAPAILAEMLRYVTVLVIVLLVVAMITRSRNIQRALWVVAGVAVVYTILKLTGVIEAIAPDRDGVF